MWKAEKYALQESIVGKKVYTFLIVSVPQKYDNWKGIMTSGDKNWHVISESESKSKITSGMNIYKVEKMLSMKL